MFDVQRVINAMIETGVAGQSLAHRMGALSMPGSSASLPSQPTWGLSDGLGDQAHPHKASQWITATLANDLDDDPSFVAWPENDNAARGGALADNAQIEFRSVANLRSEKMYLQRLSERLFGDSVGEAGGLALLRQLGASLLAACPSEPYSTASPGEAIDALGTEDPTMSSMRAMILIRAMLAAAKAGGTLTRGDVHRIVSKLGKAGLSDEELRFAEAQLEKPLDVGAIVSDIGDRLTAAEVYVASLLALNLDSPSECAYLEDLGSRLGIVVPGS